MNNQTDLFLVEEFSEQELEAISGGDGINFNDRFIQNGVGIAIFINDLNISIGIGDTDFEDD